MSFTEKVGNQYLEVLRILVAPAILVICDLCNLRGTAYVPNPDTQE